MRSSVRFARRAVELLDFGPATTAIHLPFSSRNPPANIFKTVSNVIDTKKKLSLAEWKNLKNVCQSQGFGYLACQALLKRDSGLSEVKVLMQALEETNSMNLILKIGMLPSYELYASDCSTEDQKFIYNVVDEALRLPALTAEIGVDLMKGLVAVPDWKERVSIILSKLSGMTLTKVLPHAASTAFAHQDLEFGWEILCKAVINGQNFHPILYHRILDCHHHTPNKNVLFTLLEFIQKYSLMLPLSSAKHIHKTFEESQDWVSRFSSVKPSGHCSCCKRKLKKVSLTAEEHQTLLESVEETFGVNCQFSSYEREEVEEFKLFLKKCPRYSVVVDGLNIHFRATVPQMKKFVQDLQRLGHKMLIICRGHLKKAKEFQSAFKGQLFYYVKNRTHDDAFTIYAAVSSSQETFVVSNDYFGCYYFKMNNASRSLFRQWQLSNQVIGTGYRSMNMVFPEFSPTCQIGQDNSHIHIPLVTDTCVQAYAPLGWLCVQKVTQHQKARANEFWPPEKINFNDASQVDAFKMYVNQVRLGKKLKAKPLPVKFDETYLEVK